MPAAQGGGPQSGHCDPKRWGESLHFEGSSDILQVHGISRSSNTTEVTERARHSRQPTLPRNQSTWKCLPPTCLCISIFSP